MIAAGGRHTLALEVSEGRHGSSSLPRDLGGLLTSASDFDCVLEAGRGSGRRAFLAHRAVLAARCPKLIAAMAFSTARFARSPDAQQQSGEECGRGSAAEFGSARSAPLHWPSQARGEEEGGDDSSEPSATHAALASPAAIASYCWLRSVRAPIMGLLLRWLYTGRVDTTERLFLSQLSVAARRLWLYKLADECDGESRLMAPEGAGGSKKGSAAAASCSSSFPRAHSAGFSLPAQLAMLLPLGDSVPGQPECPFSSNDVRLDLKLEATDGALLASRALLCARVEYFRTALHGSLAKARGRRSSTDAGEGAEARGPGGCRGEGPPVEEEEEDYLDLRPYGISRAELRQILRYCYTGAVTTAPAPQSTTAVHAAGLPSAGVGSSRAAAAASSIPGNDLEQLDPSIALALMPHASALLMEDLKRLCEVR